MLVNSCPEFFLRKNWVSHSLFLLGNQATCTVIELTIIQVLLMLVLAKLIAQLRVAHRTEFSADHDVSSSNLWRRNDGSVSSSASRVHHKWGAGPYRRSVAAPSRTHAGKWHNRKVRYAAEPKRQERSTTAPWIVYVHR
jgi:hypothetical protein